MGCTEQYSTIHISSSLSSSSMNCIENDGSSEYISPDIDLVDVVYVYVQGPFYIDMTADMK